MQVNPVKKNYIDAAAVFVYQLGCSLVHLALLTGSLICKMPDITKG